MSSCCVLTECINVQGYTWRTIWANELYNGWDATDTLQDVDYSVPVAARTRTWWSWKNAYQRRQFSFGNTIAVFVVEEVKNFEDRSDFLAQCTFRQRMRPSWSICTSEDCSQFIHSFCSISSPVIGLEISSSLLGTHHWMKLVTSSRTAIHWPGESKEVNL